MPNKATRILESIKSNAGVEVHDNIIKACGELEEKPSTKKVAGYVKKMLEKIKNTYGTELAAKVMKPCGYICVSEVTIGKAKEIFKRSGSIEDFLRLLNEQHIGGGKLHIKDSKIIGIYDRCYCNLPKNVEGMASVYCNCSAGWYEKLFSSVFGKEVQVRKIETILEGAKKCVFEINYGS